MTVTAIICEYNPFHNGHAYHINESKRITGADKVIAIMSGNFVQRGEPAIINKYERTRMALLSGCDLVIELPVRYSTASAEGFAQGAINTLSACNIVDNICFGTESGSLDSLQLFADILSNEPAEVSASIKDIVKSGATYPYARAKAVCDYLKLDITEFNLPNNILAIEYLRALSSTDIKPFTIKRNDKGYNTEAIDSESTFSSATAIRNALLSNIDVHSYMPECFNDINISRFVSANDISDITYGALISHQDNLTDFLDVNDEIAARIKQKIFDYTDFVSFCHLIKTKQLTYTRISRALLHIALGIKTTDDVNSRYNAEYIRVLGFRKESSDLVKKLNDSAFIPVITRVAKDISLLNDTAMSLFKEDLDAAKIYSYISKDNSFNEYTRGVIIV